MAILSRFNFPHVITCLAALPFEACELAFLQGKLRGKASLTILLHGAALFPTFLQSASRPLSIAASIIADESYQSDAPSRAVLS